MNDSQLTGTGVVPGIAHAPAAWLRQLQLPPIDESTLDEGDRDAEKERLMAAVAVVADRYDARAAAATGAANEVLTATAGLARDRGWTRAASKLVATGTRAPKAVSEAIATFVAQFEQLGGVMAERTTDLKDIRDRVMAELLGLPEPGLPDPDGQFVLMAADLAPADTAGLDPERTVALVTELGGPTSHTAIIARQLGIPCVVAVAGLDAAVAEGTSVLVDGTTGQVRWGVPEEEAAELVAKDAERREAIRSWTGPAQLASGERVQLLANVADGAAARKAAPTAAEGVGLFRTELGFLSAQSEPTAEEQGALYREVLDAFPGKKVVIRTLDAGSDKPVPFVKHEHEENPALGVRGVRLSFARDGLLARQLDGIAAARDSQEGEKSEVWVMAPMIATIDEARRFAEETRARDLKAGIMVEVPSVALLADAFLREVDFMSIGTNDLTQYTMAADRLAADLAHLTNPWQPAVLHLVARTAEAGVAAGKPVGVCGEAAADPLLACVLVGMGITSLSMAGGAISAVGAQLGQVKKAQCEDAAVAALAATTAETARQVALEMVTT
ncbi:phosphoenolpyruvate--protein phosphotransferase [Tessaracoccus rhinocerotis]|uniref:Phosphoenolpyruvate-protein phosphotransferase n=1 Tax=Tessaracoccus rhinocerotis TaxID=1689449 RepID=A0A553K1U2_9ACTN|nr:phosphoenolpyruvate--protein phosphotransferase [Tessaracoccus rhinocerotis]TRY18667.1 phosphoenolpyruvate--protein phosphotransferase [Tessaracoccus rhinocerotis]